MEDVFENDVIENDSDPKPLKEKKVRKKRQVSEATKERLRAQLKKGRATAMANRKKKLAAKKEKSKKISTPIITEPIKEESPVMKPTPEEEPIKEKPRSPKKEVIVEKPPPSQNKETPTVVNTAPAPAPRIISKPINIPPPLSYQSTFKKMKRKW